MSHLSLAPVTVFLATSQSDVAKAFYTEVLEIPLLEDNEYGLVFKLGNVELRISKLPGFTPHPWTVVDWQVPDIKATIQTLVSKGVEFARFDGMDQDEDGVWLAPEGGAKIVWFRDPDGNVLSLSERS